MFKYITFKNIIHNSNLKHKIPRNIFSKEHEGLRYIKSYKITENTKEVSSE